jgi:hypothetical protein
MTTVEYFIWGSVGFFLLWQIIAETFCQTRTTRFFQCPPQWTDYMSPFEKVKFYLRAPTKALQESVKRKHKTEDIRKRFNDLTYVEQLWKHLKDKKEINREGLYALVSKLNYSPGTIEESVLIGSLVISMIRLSAERRKRGNFGFDFDLERDTLVDAVYCGESLDKQEIEKLVDSLKEAVLSFNVREVRFVNKGKFVVKNDRTKVVFYRDEDLYRRQSLCYQPDITADELDESNPPRGGSGVPCKM